MKVKKIGVYAILSLGIMLLCLWWSYNFELTIRSASDVLFVAGLLFFFPSLIVITRATELFAVAGYISRRMFQKDKGQSNYFKTFQDYKEYKELNRGHHEGRKGLVGLCMGAFYMVVSLILSNFV